jgi:hypothetical protein
MLTLGMIFSENQLPDLSDRAPATTAAVDIAQG